MQKLLSLVLAVIMLALCFMLYTGAAETDVKIYTPLDLANGKLGKVDFTMDLVEDTDTYVHFTAKAGAYGNNGVCINFKDDGFAIFEYPILKIEYRTNSQASKIDVTTRSSVGEMWPSSHPAPQGDEKWHTITIDINTINEPATRIVDKTEKGITVRFKPWGGQTQLVPEGSYFDIKYMAFFKNSADAEAFAYSNAYNDAAQDLYFGETGFIDPDGEAEIVKIDAACEELIDKILSTPTDVTVTGTKYYVAADGADTNDGKSPETPWKTVGKVNEFKFSEGDGVFFKRGDSFRANGVTLTLQNGVTYSAYGEGDKPVLVGSVNASNALKWRQTDYPNIYRYIDPINEAGSVIFDGGKAWGIMITKSGDNCMDNGVVSNGLETFKSGGQKWEAEKTLRNNLEFCNSGGYFYLYSANGNPGEVFESIEISEKYHGINGSPENVTVDNLKLFGYGGHGISVSNVKNFKVQNSVFGWIGGSIQHSDVRYGNAIQNWANADGFIIDSCYSYQVYDCAYTTQLTQRNGPEINISNVVFSNNVAEYCNTGLEVWNGDDSLNDRIHYKDCLLYGNYVRRSGYGWSHQRPIKDGNFYYGGFFGSSQTWDNYQVYDNYFTCAVAYGIKSRPVSKINSFFHDNTYIMNRGTVYMNTMSMPETDSGYIHEFPYNDYNVEDLSKRGIEPGAKFYFLKEDYAPEAFNCERVNDIYPETTFTDIPEGHWATGYIDFTVSRGLYNGVAPDKFAPESNMTRAMFVTVLARYDEATLENGAKWYDGAVKWAIEKGFMDAGDTRPDDNITRAEMAVMIKRYIDTRCLITNAASIAFGDADLLKGELGEAVAVCIDAGIFSGYEDNTFKPSNLSTRAQVAAVFSRLDNFVVTAKPDMDALVEAEKAFVLEGEALEKSLLVMSANATKSLYDDNGVNCVRFDPTVKSGYVEISLYQRRLEKVDFYKFGVIRFKYKIKDGESKLDIGLKANMTQWLDDKGPYRPVNTNDTWTDVILEYSNFTGNSSATLPFESREDYQYTFKPWGNGFMTISEDAYFEIEKIGFFADYETAKNVDF